MTTPNLVWLKLPPYPPDSGLSWNEWHLCNPEKGIDWFRNPSGAVGDVIQVDPSFETYDAYLYPKPGPFRKGHGVKELGRFTTLADAQSVVETAYRAFVESSI